MSATVTAMEKGNYELTVGLEVHVELSTATKMFCRSRNDPDEMLPNRNICPVCMAHPGTLPVINKEAVRHVLRVGLAVGGTLADYTEFDRKNYFYPDLPKGYQLSQYEYPLVSGGAINGVTLTRIHLEEDTARSQHDEVSGSTVIDYNRAGVPLLELVTEPVIHSPEEAGMFARELRMVLRALGASSANMEKGEMRVEANISVAKKGEPLGTKVEVKNLNSIRAAERAIAYEFERHVALLEKGEKVIQQTRGWDEHTQTTFEQRVKEGSADYRYFPDPDLPSLRISEIADFSKENLSKNMPLMPWELREHYNSMGISSDDVEMYVRDAGFRSFFDSVARELSESKNADLIRTASNYITTDLAKIIRDNGSRDLSDFHEIIMPAGSFSEIIRMVGSGQLSSRGAKDLLVVIAAEGGDPRSIATERNMLQSGDADALQKIIDLVVSENPAAVGEYKSGKEQAIQFLIGKAMQASKGTANPAVLKELIANTLAN